MSESSTHKQTKAKAAGRGGKTEVPLSRGRRLDAISASGNRATEVERSGSSFGLEKAAERLKDSGAKQRILQVPQNDMEKATEAMKEVGVTGTVKNITGTQTKRVR